jgi:hypothetical protein
MRIIFDCAGFLIAGIMLGKIQCNLGILGIKRVNLILRHHCRLKSCLFTSSNPLKRNVVAEHPSFLTIRDFTNLQNFLIPS